MRSRDQQLSIEAVVLGRNDEYEPDWTAKLHASLRYNHRLFEAHGVDYRVAFVEWNPPDGRPLLSPTLVRAYPFLRALVVDADVHARLCLSSDLHMMLNFAYNPALRTSRSDYCLITSGDLFFGQELVQRIARGLRPGCLYRAERVNIRETIDVASATPDSIEAPEQVVSVDTCTEPPYDRPPYSHASGDFLLVDRVTMAGLRGFDESIRFARLHLDSRFCVTAMHAGLDCELLGRIYHLNHRNAYTNRLHDYPGRDYDYNADLPYVNPLDWGLARWHWFAAGERCWRIAPPGDGAAWMPVSLDADERKEADRVTARLLDVRSATLPSRPDEGVPCAERDVDVSGLTSHWDGAVVVSAAGHTTVTTVDAQWGYSALLPLEPPSDVAADDWCWLRVRVRSWRGSVGIGALCDEELIAEHLFVGDGEPQDVWLPLRRTQGVALLVRNAAPTGASTVVLQRVAIVSQLRQPPRYLEFLLGSQPEVAGASR